MSRPPPKVLLTSGTCLTATDLAVTLDAIIAPVVVDLGYDLVRIQLSGKPGDMTLQVMAEDRTTGQLTLGQCAEISRALDLPLETADPIDGEYALEVSSPGIDRPLTRRSDWEKWAGHEVRLKLDPAIDGRARAHGVIIDITSDMVSIDVKTVGAIILPFAAISAAKLVLTPKLINATRPLDSSGADELIELPEITDDLADPDNDNNTTED
jgi:ribosome maturation factor RimP